MVLTKLFVDFFNSERAGGLILIGCALVSLVLSNLFPAYLNIWQVEVANHHLTHWINDGLMTVFFLLIGLELEREIYIGELSTVKSALQPAVAALGGMVVPAAIYYFININEGNLNGLGIPMATDIAFALAVLAMLGSRIPPTLKIFLTALAVIDDLGAIVIIAIFYTNSIQWFDLSIAGGIFFLLLILNRLKVYSLLPYLTLGVAMWYFMLNSGVHATITGVLLAFAIPFGSGDEQSPSYKLQHFLHKPVAFLVLPLFALANTSIPIQSDFYVSLGSVISIGIMAGLLVGKPLGIVFFTFLSTKLRLTTLPDGLKWSDILGAGILGGIGFTMSIFISLLAFDDPSLQDQAKISVMIISLVAGLFGYLWLRNSSVN